METASRKPLRLWPGTAIALLLVLAGYVAPLVSPEVRMYGILVRLGGALAILLWWLFFSRAPWVERVGALLLMAVALAATYPLVHPSIRGGFMGMMLVVAGTPVLALALVAWAAATRGLPAGSRGVALVVALLVASGAFTLLRTDGITGDGASQLAWRWSATPEQRLLAQTGPEPLEAGRAAPAPPSEPAPPAERSEPTAREAGAAGSPPSTPAPDAAATAGDHADAPASDDAPASSADPARPAPAVKWAGFRGATRDSVVRGVRIETDWSASPPVELWRRPIGPGWSSFAVAGDFLYTQEQRGEHEVVACYRVSSGKPVWQHRDAVRFYESNGGAGPRGTPTVHGGRVYTLGATGIVNALDAGTGRVAWSRDAAADTGAELPGWGFAGSPLVLDDLLIVAASSSLIAYDLGTGNRRWSRPGRGTSYSSPHVMTIEGVQQIVLLSGSGAVSVAPSDGQLLWEHAWPGAAIVQPATADGGLLISTGDAMGGVGVRRLAVARGPDGWTVEERWTSRGLKPYFNDYVVHQGHAFGFDGRILSCIDLSDGTRTWKGGRYGHGQLVLLAEQGLLLVVSEEGELALVRASAREFTEVARFPAIEGKTWNHPVLVGSVLLVRNGEEMAAFRLAPGGQVLR
ncbi:MAG TPA: PQQ-binding-like beta-propeller repeat protein [Vicinamibacterales bacterium]|nr:PQQ-binding-like beta-propeller repeat protein [Vicinamibacterales bacterium]